MKKIFRIVLTLLFIAVMFTPGFAANASSKKAAKKYDRIVAHVVSLDVTGKTIVVNEEKTGATRTVKISAKAASQLKVGDRVRIKLKPGTDESAGVLVLKPQPPQPQEPQAPAAVPTPEKK